MLHIRPAVYKWRFFGILIQLNILKNQFCHLTYALQVIIFMRFIINLTNVFYSRAEYIVICLKNIMNGPLII